MNIPLMTKPDPATLKRIASLFAIPITTLQTWAKSENRLAHMELLTHAIGALELCKFYSDISHEFTTPHALGQQLGFDNPLTICIDGIAQRTFRAWFESDEKHGLLNGILIGYHWRMVQSISVQSGFSTISALLLLLDAHNVRLDGLVKLYQASPDTLTRLISIYHKEHILETR